MPPALQLLRQVPRAEPAPSWNFLSDPRRSLAAGPPPGGHQAIWRAAVEAEEQGAVDCPLEGVWEDHVKGRLRAWWESVGPDRILLVARVATGSADLGSDDADILARILVGRQQKVVAADLGIAPSTVSGRYVRALDRLELTPSSIPVAVVLAAQAYVGVTGIPRARTAFFEVSGQVCMVISVPRPDTTLMTNLTCAEQEVAAWLIEGCSRFEIARRRRTSVHTVARQFHSIFAVQGVTGRFALIRSGVSLGSFAETDDSPGVARARSDSHTEEMSMAARRRQA
jgi:DNA-binding CsgD family transcriptional regulator